LNTATPEISNLMRVVMAGAGGVATSCWRQDSAERLLQQFFNKNNALA